MASDSIGGGANVKPNSGTGGPTSAGITTTNNSSSTSSTRSICFVQRTEYEFSGNSVWPFALALGDLDNDGEGDCELAVGNVHGDLFIYKYSFEKPWKKASKLGSIVCIGIGDVLNEGKNFLVTLSCEGWCHVFDVPSDNNGADNSKSKTGSGGVVNTSGVSDSSVASTAAVSDSPSISTHSMPTAVGDNRSSYNKENREEELKPIYKQNDIGVNVKLLLLDDIDGDGKIELVIGHTDKFVRAYRWEPYCERGNSSLDISSGCVLIPSFSKLETNINNLIKSPSNYYSSTATSSDFNVDKENNCSDVGSNLDSHSSCRNKFPSFDDRTEKMEYSYTSSNYSNRSNDSHGRFVPVYGWRLEHIIGTVSVIFWNGKRHLAAAQRGNNYAILFVDSDGSCDPTMYQGKVHYQQITGGRARNAEANCGILGNIRRNNLEMNPTIFATVTQNGNIYLQEFKNGKHHNLLSLTVKDYHLFPFLHKFDITGEGREEVVVCARNGMTYIIDHSKNVVKFPFQKDVLAFIAGDFSIKPNCKAPCLVYVTFHNKILLYYDIKLPRLDSTSLIESMLKDSEVVEALKKLGIHDKPLEQKKLYRKLLYDRFNSDDDEKG